ncbi:MAG: hypothetical protein JWO38_7858 [Gemmataceae bacterium]|nr:hypothetical protein [Gemmataceae bacterium]
MFLTALLAAPADTTPLLVYADWFDDRGDPRADLLRVAAARIVTPRDGPGWDEQRAAAGDWVARHGASFLGPLTRVLSPTFGVLDAGPAWLLFLHADLPAWPGSLPVGTRLRGTVERYGTRLRGTVDQVGRVFPATVAVTARAGSRLAGRQVCRFRPGTGRWSIDGVVAAGWVAYVIDRESGPVTYPGLYLGEVADGLVVGRWQVPSYCQEGEFALEVEV